MGIEKRRSARDRSGSGALVRSLIAVVTTLAVGRGASAQAPAYLVKDINTTQAVRDPYEDEPSSFPHDFAILDGVAYFAAGDVQNTYGEARVGEELWRSDGTPAGTWLVRDLYPGSGSASPTDLQVHDGKLYFLASDGDHFGLWRSDGTAAGTELVTAVGEQARAIRLTRFTNGWLVVAGKTQSTTDFILMLYRVNDAGEVTPLTGVYGYPYDDPPAVVVGDNVAYFSSEDPLHGAELWQTDGTLAGTRLTVDISPGPDTSYPTGITVLGSLVLCAASDVQNGRQLWVIDGDRVTRIETTTQQEANPTVLTSFGNAALFSTNGDDVADYLLWRSDGTQGGTAVIAPVSGTLTPFAPFGGALYFGSGDELWRTDGTTGGTQRVSEFTDSQRGYDAFVSVADAGDFLLVAVRTSTGVDLWRSDGTTDGATLIRSFAERTIYWAGTTVGEGRVAGNGRFVFAADDGSGIEPWVTDGTAAGTQLLHEINPGATDFFGDLPMQSSFVDADGTLVFYADDRQGNPRFLWRSDGTAAGTARIGDTPEFFLPEFFADGNPLVALGRTVFLHFFEPDVGAELWSVTAPDGPARRVTDLIPGPEGSNAYIIGAINGELLLSASDGIHGTEVFTPSGDGLVKDIAPGPQSSNPYWDTGQPVVATLKGFLYFFTAAEGQGLQLWRSDGTTDGTTLVADLSRDGAYFDPTPLIIAGRDRLAVIARVGERLPTDPMVGIWYSDGTAEGTTLVAQAQAQRDDLGAYDYWPRLLGFAGDTLLFARQDTAFGIELWRSDGTVVGTAPLADINPGPGESAPTGGVALGDRLVFFADDGVHGREPWITDGAGDTHLLLDINPGPASSRQRFDIAPLPVGDLAVFAAADAEHGRELWRTDGTAANTVLVADVATGAASSSPLGLTVSGSRLFFTANDGEHSRELWAVDLDDLGCTAPCIAPTPTPVRTPRPTWTSGPPLATLTPTPTPTERSVEECLSRPDSGCAVLTIGTVTGAPGTTVEVPVVFATGGVDVAGIQLDMLLADDVTTTPEDCRIAPGIDKHLYAAFPPDVEQAVRLILLSLDNVDPLPNGALFTCTYRISADATPGRHPIACAGQVASTPDGDAIDEAFRCLDGAVIVSGPTPLPTATPKSGTHESADASAAGDGCQIDRRPSAGSALLLLLPLAAMLGVRLREDRKKPGAGFFDRWLAPKIRYR